MTTALARRMEAPQAILPPRLCLRGDGTGRWTLTGSGRADRQFADFETALGSARHIPERHAATIEVWQEGEYVCCLPAEDGAEDTAMPYAARSAFPAAKRHSNRGIEFLIPLVGFGFWLVLVVATLAASLGWRFLRF